MLIISRIFKKKKHTKKNLLEYSQSTRSISSTAKSSNTVKTLHELDLNFPSKVSKHRNTPNWLVIWQCCLPQLILILIWLEGVKFQSLNVALLFVIVHETSHQ